MIQTLKKKNIWKCKKSESPTDTRFSLSVEDEPPADAGRDG